VGLPAQSSVSLKAPAARSSFFVLNGHPLKVKQKTNDPAFKFVGRVSVSVAHQILRRHDGELRFAYPTRPASRV
jgi:hypothetical protein